MRVHHLNCGTMHPLGSPEPFDCQVLHMQSNATRLERARTGAAHGG